MNNNEIVAKIKELQTKINKEQIDGATPQQLAKYLVEVDKLKALMLVALKKSNEENKER